MIRDVVFAVVIISVMFLLAIEFVNKVYYGQAVRNFEKDIVTLPFDVKPQLEQDVIIRAGAASKEFRRHHVCDETCATGGENPYRRGYYKYGCPTGDCCKKNCCQVMPAKCTFGGGNFVSRFGNEGVPEAGPVPMPTMRSGQEPLHFVPSVFHAPELFPAEC